jgi:hypothetical protein
MAEYVEYMGRVATNCIVLIAAFACACVESQPSDNAEQDESTSGSESESGETDTTTGEASYPAGPYGTDVGDVVENLSFVDENDTPVELEPFYGGPQRALVLFGTAAWCAVCIDEAEQLTITLASQGDKVIPLGVLYEDALGEQPTAAVALGYNNAVDAFEFVADPSQRFSDFFDPAGALPRMLLIDTATMTLVYKTQGFDEQALLAAIDAIPAG